MEPDSSDTTSHRTTKEIYEEYKNAVINTYNVKKNIDPHQYTCAHLASEGDSDSISAAAGDVMRVKAVPIVEGKYMVKVRTLSGVSTELTVVGADTIAEVKEKFAAALLASGQEPMKGVSLLHENLPLDESRTLQSHGIGADAVINAVVTEEALKKETDEALKKDQKILQLAKDLDRWKKSYGIFVNKEEGDQRRKKAIEDARLVEAVRDAKAAVEADPRDRRKYERLIAAYDTAAVAWQGDDHDERARRYAAATRDEYKIDAMRRRNTLAILLPGMLAEDNEEAVLKKLKALVKEDILNEIMAYQRENNTVMKSDWGLSGLSDDTEIMVINKSLREIKRAIEYSYMHFIKNHKYYYKSCGRDTLVDKAGFHKMMGYIEQINADNPWIKEYIDETIESRSTKVNQDSKKKKLMIQEVTLYMACFISAMNVKYTMFKAWIDASDYKDKILMPELRYYVDTLINEFDDSVDHENVATRVFDADARALDRGRDFAPLLAIDGGKRKRRTRRNKKYNKKSKKHHKKRSYKKHHKKNHKKTHKKH